MDMFYTMGILLLLSAFLLIRWHTNFYSIVFSIQILFLDLALFFVFVYVAKTGNYMYPDNILFMPDYYLYLKLLKMKLSLYTIIRLQNIGFAGYMACMLILLCDLDTSKKKRQRKLIGFLGAILPAFYIVFYDPVTKLNFLTLLYDGSFNNTAADIIKALNAFNYAWIFLYLLAPLIVFSYSCFQIKSVTKRKQLISLLFSLFCLDLMCLNIFILGPFKQTYMNLSVDNLLCLPDVGGKNIYDSTYIPIITLIFSNIMLLLLFRFHGLDRIDFFKHAKITRMALKQNKDVRGVFHTYKNEMLSVNMIARQLDNTDDPEKIKHLINRLYAISGNAMEKLTRVSESYKGSDIFLKSSSVGECIRKAISGIVFDDNIKIETEIEENVYALCDNGKLQSSVENIINNSQEAIRVANRRQGIIKVTLNTEYEWVFIKITDNGTGIPKKEINKIFNAFYSTKHSSENWGIGLNYVFRSVRAMKGFVYAESVPDQFTTITIVLQKTEQL